MKYIITLVLAMVFLTTNLYSEANAPKPLRQLVVERQYIVVGYVVKTQEIFYRKRVATIAISKGGDTVSHRTGAVKNGKTGYLGMGYKWEI